MTSRTTHTTCKPTPPEQAEGAFLAANSIPEKQSAWRKVNSLFSSRLPSQRKNWKNITDSIRRTSRTKHVTRHEGDV